MGEGEKEEGREGGRDRKEGRRERKKERDGEKERNIKCKNKENSKIEEANFGDNSIQRRTEEK